MLKGIECLNPRLQSLVAPLQSVRINALPYLFHCMPAIRVLPQPCCMFKALRMDLCQELLHSRCSYCRSITHSTRKTGASSLSMEDVRILSPLLSPPSPLSTVEFTDVWQLRDNVWAICPEMQTFRLRLYDRSGNDFFYVTPFQPSQYFVSVHPSASLVFTNTLHQMLILQAIVHGCQLHTPLGTGWGRTTP